MNRTEKLTYYLLVITGLLLTALFALVWFWPGSSPHNFRGIWHLFDWVLFMAVTYVVWHQIYSELLLWLVAEKMQRPKPVQPEPGLRVAFITTFVPSSEPIELLEKVLPALQRAKYPHDTWLLDEGNSKEAWAICQRLGVKYFTRKGIAYYNTESGTFLTKTKGGNHNAWYDAFGHTYDFVAQIDTDFIPRKDFLTRTLGYFSDPSVAFVGTPQHYGNTARSVVARGAAQQQYTFYGPILRGLFGRDMAMLIGANHVIRVAALKDIGWYRAHLTEDLLTGLTLHSRHWKSVYVPEVLAYGEGPETWSAYFNQQMRWSFGCFDILFHHSGKLLRNMNREQRRYYVLMMQHYFSGLAAVLGIALLLMNFVFGISATSISLAMLLPYIALLLWQSVITIWMQRFNANPKTERGLMFAGRMLSIAVWPIYFLAFVGALRGKRLLFTVTPKGAHQNSAVSLSTFMPHLIVGTITAVGFAASFVTHHQSPIIEFWAILTIVSMFGISFGAWLHGMRRIDRSLFRNRLQLVFTK